MMISKKEETSQKLYKQPKYFETGQGDDDDYYNYYDEDSKTFLLTEKIKKSPILRHLNIVAVRGIHYVEYTFGTPPQKVKMAVAINNDYTVIRCSPDEDVSVQCSNKSKPSLSLLYILIYIMVSPLILRKMCHLVNFILRSAKEENAAKMSSID